MNKVDTKEDSWLGQKLILRQPIRSYRVAIDAALLAAAIPLKPGKNALELGTGVGAVALALALRVHDCRVTAVEIQHELSDLAHSNVITNGLEDQIDVIQSDILDLEPPSNFFSEVLFNPPYLKPESNDASPDKIKQIATVEGKARLADWYRVASAHVISGGGVTAIHRADRLSDLLNAAAKAGIGSLAVFPIWPHKGSDARRIIVRGVKGGAAPLRILSGLTLHTEGAKYSSQAESILQGEASIELI
jgi:tRNA1(Val) A37 N6-methylase TrmN6